MDAQVWAMTREAGVRRIFPAACIVLSLALAGCNETMSSGQKATLTGGALGAGIGMVAGGSFGQVVGAGLIGGSLGYIVGSSK